MERALELPPLPGRLQAAVEALPDGLREHIERARRMAREAAQGLGLDPLKTDVAVAAHDIYRAMQGATLLQEARRLGISVDWVEQQVPILLHGPVAAERLRSEFGIDDPEVVEAVRWHTTACPGLGPIGKLVFLADKLEPEKIEGDRELGRIARLMGRDLDRAVLEYLTLSLQRLLRQGALLHPASVEARNHLLLALGRGEGAGMLAGGQGG
ncbi:MAG: bis(5'-nucleosyl)-tetraphosphatase (symmetrical) YqeK [Chloroflexi bacterium]|nr:bis(5'-nucleosyl)-tetraphosphatase (symmetrical) YqeK [Chloroflexota bacterium]